VIGSRLHFSWRMLALTGFVALTAAIFLVLFNLAGGVDVGKRHRLTAVVPTALQLSQNADVRTAGVRIGSVERISNRGATAVLELAIEDDHWPVHRDGRVQVRAKTLVGENYVDLESGAGAPLRDGDELPIARAKPATQLDDILSTFSPPRRTRLKRLLSGIGPGLGNSRSVGTAVSGIAELLEGGKRVAPAIDAERDALRGLVADLGVVFRAVGERRESIAELVSAARRSATLVAAEDDALRAGLRQLPAALTQVSATTSRLARVGRRAGPVLDDLTASMRRLTPVVDELPPTADATLGALRGLSAAAPAARSLLTALRRAGDPTAAFVPALDSVLRDLRPALEYLAPYSKDAGAFFAGLGQGAATRDAVGNLARIQPILNPTALTLVGETERRALEALVGVGAARLFQLSGSNLYPKPETLATPQPPSGAYPRLQRDAPGR